MIRLTRSLRAALGLCLLALGGLNASSAQASPVWMVGNANLVSGSRQVTASNGGIFSTAVVLHTKIGGNKVEFTCVKGELLGLSLEPGGNITTGTKGRWGECTTKINGMTNAACKPNNNGTEPGIIVSNEGKGRLTKHSTGEGVALFESIVEEVVSGVKQPVLARIKSSIECPIGSNIAIIGPRVSLVDVNGMEGIFFEGLLNEKRVHEIKEGPLTEIWALSKTEEHKAQLLGEMALELSSGETWSGLL